MTEDAPADALLLTEADLRPLTVDAGSIDGAIDAVEQATLALHRGAATQATFLGHPQASGRPSARVSFATAGGIATGVRVFGTPAPDNLGLVHTTNSRYYLLSDVETGQLLALMDFVRLNALRVGAIGGLAARHLAPPGARTLAVVGSGQQARTQVQAVCRAVPSIERVRVYSPTPAHREAFAEEMATWLGVKCEAMSSVAGATRDADVVDLATSSTTPVIERAHVKPGALVISMTDNQLPAEFVDTARAVFITWEAVAENVFPRQPYTSRIAAGTFTRADLGAARVGVVADEVAPRRTADDVVVFDLTAFSIHDLAVARWAYDWARANGVGTPFVLSRG
ncbi:MAG: hypothetical protein QOF51_1503 [Chloroflexota bacterium]|nr:hypothetical protein [Chloroflexota bacterium]